jgi:CRP/FNR family cyclic AMP-dependent transcriptional regulator
VKRDLATKPPAKKLRKFDPKTFLSTIDCGRRIAAFPKKQTIFSQGDVSDAVFYIQKGKVRLTVVSPNGKEGTIGILSEGDFFGEGCLTGQRFRLSTATALTDCSLMRIEKKAMVGVLHQEHRIFRQCSWPNGLVTTLWETNSLMAHGSLST